tara:strand:- start:42 stop:1370 length:1329 start_codon:yes stop_codon:yes gene_type:complete
MAIINSYPTVTPTGSDLIIGTDVSTTPNSTKTFTIDSINALATGTPATGTLNTLALFTSAVAVGDSTIVRSGAGATSTYTFGGGTAINNTSITTDDLTTNGNTILGNAGTDTLTVNAAATFADNVTINGDVKSLTMGQTTPIIFLDGGGSERLRIGGDISSNSIIQDSSSGDLILISNTELEVKSGLLGENYAKFTKDGPIELYYDNVKKFETTSTGITITGTQSSFSGQVTIPTTPVAATDAASKSYVDTSISGAAYLPLAGGTMSGDIILPDNIQLEVGSAAGGDLRIYHNGSDSYIDDQGTGNLILKGSTNILVSTSSGGQMAQFTDSGSAFLYHSGNLRLSTTSAGVTLTGDLICNGGDISLGAGAGIVKSATDVSIDATGGSVKLQSGGTTKIEVAATKISITSAIISNYANNAAALAAGLVAGDLYRNGDSLNIVH